MNEYTRNTKCNRAHQLTILALAVVLSFGWSCGGGSSSPTAPAGGPAFEITTAQGTFVVHPNGEPVDVEAVKAAVERGYEKAGRQIGARVDELRFDGYRLIVMPPDWELNGEHRRNRQEIRMRSGVERVVAHELQHLFAWELGRPHDCKVLQDHPGGYDLHCARL
ncbi:MAG: hypothetical protein ACOC92_01525 [bacterium]